VTLPELMEMVNLVLGPIDTDPFSTEVGNHFVHAKKFFTKNDNPFNQKWEGVCWVCGPKELQEEIVDKLNEEIELGNCTSCILVTRVDTASLYFHKLMKKYLLCFLEGESNHDFADPNYDPIEYPIVNCYNPQAFFYHGNNSKKFNEVFSELGVVMKNG